MIFMLAALVGLIFGGCAEATWWACSILWHWPAMTDSQGGAVLVLSVVVSQVITLGVCILGVFSG